VRGCGTADIATPRRPLTKQADCTPNGEGGKDKSDGARLRGWLFSAAGVIWAVPFAPPSCPEAVMPAFDRVLIDPTADDLAGALHEATANANHGASTP